MPEIVPELPELLNPALYPDGTGTTWPVYATNAAQWICFADNGADAVLGNGHSATEDDGSDRAGMMSAGWDITKPYMYIAPTVNQNAVVSYWEWDGAPIVVPNTGSGVPYRSGKHSFATNCFAVYCWDIRPLSPVQRAAFTSVTFTIEQAWILNNSFGPFPDLGGPPALPPLEARIPDRVVDWADYGPYYDMNTFDLTDPLNPYPRDATEPMSSWDAKWMPKDSWSPQYTSLGDPRWSRATQTVDDTVYQGYNPAYDPFWQFFDGAPWGYPTAGIVGFDLSRWDGDFLQLQDNATSVWDHEPRKFKGGEWAWPPKDLPSINWTTIGRRTVVGTAPTINIRNFNSGGAPAGFASWTVPVNLNTMVRDGRLVIVVGTAAQLDSDLAGVRTSYLQNHWSITGATFRLGAAYTVQLNPMLGFPVGEQRQAGRGQFRRTHRD